MNAQERIVYSIFYGNKAGEDTTRIEFDDFDPAIVKARELAREGFAIVTIQPYLLRGGEIAAWSPFLRNYAEDNGRLVSLRIDSDSEPFPGRVVLDWIAFLPERFLNDSLASTLLLDPKFIDLESWRDHEMMRQMVYDDLGGDIVFGIQHHYQSKHDGSKYVRFLRGARGQRQVNLELAALQLIYDDLRWKEDHEEAVFVDLAVDYLSHIFGMVEIVDDIPDVSFVVDLHWNWEQFVVNWRIRNEIEQCITPFMISSLIHVLDSPFNPLASLRRLERQLMANGVIPCRLLASPHYIEIKESGIRI